MPDVQDLATPPQVAEDPGWQERFQQITGTHPDKLGLKTMDQAHRYLLKLNQMQTVQVGPSRVPLNSAPVIGYNPQTYRPPQ